jgi:hypothetical protein
MEELEEAAATEWEYGDHDVQFRSIFCSSHALSRLEIVASAVAFWTVHAECRCTRRKLHYFGPIEGLGPSSLITDQS